MVVTGAYSRMEEGGEAALPSCAAGDESETRARLHAASFTNLADVRRGSQSLLSVSRWSADLKSGLLLAIE